MSETLDTNSTAPQGKGIAVAGFILALVGLVFSGIIAGIAALSIATGGSGWLMYFWLVLCIASVVMCAMGMSKLGKTGGKKGLAIAGLVVGIVATVWAIVLTLGLGAADAAVDGDLGDEFRKQMEKELNK